MEAGLPPEGFATASDRYADAQAALRCLVKDCNITGIFKPEDDPNFGTLDLFV